MGSYIQPAGSTEIVAYTVYTVGLAKLAEANGLQVLKAQWILAIAISTTRAIFFYECATITGNSRIKKIITSTRDILALPMKGTEMIWNSYINSLIYKIFGWKC